MIPDFEIKARVRARELTARTRPDTETQGENAEVGREESRRGLPGEIEPGERYEDVELDRRVVGRTKR